MNQFWGIQGDHIEDDALVCVAYDKWHQVGYAAGHAKDISSMGLLNNVATTTIDSNILTASYGDDDIVLLKFNDSAQILWALVLGGTKDDYAYDLTTDNEGHVYLVGSYMYDINFVSIDNTTSAYFSDDGGGNSSSQGFVCSYDSNGQFRWATSEGSTGDDAIHAITNTSDGVAIIGHITHLPGAYPDSVSGTLGGPNTDIYIKKYTHDGSPIWQMAGGSELDDYEYDEEFNIKKWDITYYNDTLYFGATYSGLTFNFYSSTNYSSDNQNVGLVKLSTNPDYVLGGISTDGEIIWLNHQLNGSGEQNNVSIGADCNGLFLAGIAENWLIWQGPSPGIKITSGADDVFLAKYNRANGQPKAYRMLQTPTANVDEITDIELDGLGNLLATGKHQGSISTGGPLITGATSGGCFLLMYNTSLIYQAHSTINATGSNEMGYDLAITNSSDLYLVGTSNGNLVADQSPSNTSYDSFLVAYNVNQLISSNCCTPFIYTCPSIPIVLSTNGCSYTTPDLISIHNTQAACLQHLVTQNPAVGSPLWPGMHNIQILDNTNNVLCSYPISIPEPPGQLTNCPSNNNLTVTAALQVEQPDYLSQVGYTSICSNVGFEIYQVPAAGSILYGLQPTETNIYLTYNGIIIDQCSFISQKIDTLPPQLECPLDQTYYITNACSLQVALPVASALSESNGCVVGDLSNYTYLGTHEGHTYYLSNFTSNYIEAQSLSTQLGGHLLILSQVSENSIININSPTWIGLNDIAEENIFSWPFDTALQSTNWLGSMEPDNVGLDGNYPADGVVILPAIGFPWADESIFSSHPFIIEFDCEQVTYTPPIIQSSGPVSFSSLSQGDYSVSFAAFDMAGNMATCGYDIDIIDTIAPVIACPMTALSIPLNTSCSALVPHVLNQLNITDNCPLGLTISQNPIADIPIPSAQGFPIFITAMDQAGNQTTCEIQILPQDVLPPQFICPTTQILPLNADCQNTLPDYRYLISPIDNCTSTPDISIEQFPAPGITVMGVGTLPIQFTITDNSGNTSTCSMTVYKSDVTGPVLTCPTQSFIYLDPFCSATMPDLRMNATVSDNCSESGIISLTQNPSPGTSISGVGPMTVTLQATDTFNNSSICTIILQKTDSIGPQFSCPINVTIPVDSDCTAVVPDYRDQVIFSDLCHESTEIVLLQEPLQGSEIYSLEPFLVHITAIDPFGNENECSFEVTPQDVTPPAITCPQSIIPMVMDSNCNSNLPDFSGYVGINNICSTDEWIATTQVPAVGVAVTDLNPFEIIFSVTDNNNNSSSCSAVIQPIDINAPSHTCLSTQLLPLTSGCQTEIPDYRSLISIQDACTTTNDLILIQNPPAGSLLVGEDTIAITIQIIDLSNNMSQCTFDLISYDDQNPTIVCLENQTAPLVSNCAFVVADYTNLLDISDNCTSVNDLIITQSPAPGEEIYGSQITIHLSVTDEANNTTECSFELIAEDDTAPSITCPNEISLAYLNADCNFQFPDLISLVQVSDNCSTDTELTMIQNPIAGSLIYESGTYPIIIELTDAANNTSSCSAEITVVDTSEFQLICPPNQFVVLDDQCQYTLPNYGIQVQVSEPCTNGSNYAWDQWPPIGDMLVGETDALITMILQSPTHGLTSCSFHIVTQADPSNYIQCPLNDTLQLSSTCTATLPNYGGEVLLNNECTNSSFWQINQIPEAGSQISTGQIVQIDITYLGETTQCIFPIAVIDTIAPSINCPSVWEVQVNSDCNHLMPILWDEVIASDNCNSMQELTWTQIPEAGSTLASNQLAELIATDLNGHSSHCMVELILSNFASSSLNCPADIALIVDPNCNYIVPQVTELVTINSTCAEILQWTQSPSPTSIWSGEFSDIEISAMLSDGTLLTCSTLVQIPTADIQLICPDSIEQQVTCDSTFNDFTDLIVIASDCAAAISYEFTQYPEAGGDLVGMPAQMIFETTTTSGFPLQCEATISYTESNSTYLIECPNIVEIPLSSTCEYIVPEIFGLTFDDCGQTLDTLWNISAFAGTNASVNTYEQFVLQSTTDSQLSCIVPIDYTTAPTVLNCPADTIIYSTEEFVILENFVPINDGINCLDQPWTLTQYPEQGTNLLTPTDITITYNVGELTESSCTFLVTPFLLEDPFIAICPDTLFVPIINNCEISGQQINALVSTIQVFSELPYSWIQLPATSSYSGNTTLNFEVTNTDGNSFSCDILVNAQDLTYPQVTATIPSLELYLNENCLYVLPDLSNYILVQENCSYNLIQTPNMGSILYNDTLASMVVSDGAGHTQTIDIQVLLINPEPVILNQLSDVVLSASPVSCDAIFDWTTAIEIPDNCFNFELQSEALTQTEFEIGTHLISYFAVNEMGLTTDTMSLVINVIDDLAPTIIPLANDQIILCTTDAAWEMPFIFDCSAYVSELIHDPLQPGINEVLLNATDALGHISSYSFEIIVPTMTWNGTNIPTQICQNGDSLELPIQNAEGSVWYMDGNQIGSYLNPQIWSTGWHQILLEVTQEGCSMDTTWTIEVLPAPEIIGLDTAYNVCGDTLELAWTNTGTEIQWTIPKSVDLNTTTNTISFTFSTYQAHYILLTSALGNCTSEFQLAIYNDAPIDTLYAGLDQHIQYGLTAPLNGLSSANDVIWTSNDTSIMFSNPNENYGYVNVSQIGTYDLFLTATNGSCMASDTLRLTFEGSQLPNTITPNGDGINDTFHIGEAADQEIHIKIVNRWGQLVYENMNYKNDWSGVTNNDETLPNDTYFYEVVLARNTLSGFIQIKR
jgi:gliding motility-associated-like protein